MNMNSASHEAQLPPNRGLSIALPRTAQTTLGELSPDQHYATLKSFGAAQNVLWCSWLCKDPPH